MTDQHPIAPPPELVERWAYILENRTDAEAFTIAAQWGADQARVALAEPQPAADGEVAATGKPGLQVEPIPMSNRLPEAGDCDAEGRCWWWHPPTYAASTGWWSFEPWEWTEDVTHWLPSHALPLPKELK
jgi:hypothetical protein